MAANVTPASVLQYEVYIFPNNSPWGVIKHPQRGNVYRHIVNFPAGDSARTTFVNTYLNNGTPISTVKYENYSITPINELTFQFKVKFPRDQKSDDLTHRDFCMVKKRNDTRRYYYTLAVARVASGYVEFTAELDIFFTYSINELLDDKRESYVRRGHIKRYKPDGSIDWDRVLLNKETIAEPGITVKVQQPFLVTKNLIKWVVVYVKNDGITALYNDYESHFITSPLATTYNNGIRLPYTILLFPYHPSKEIVIKYRSPGDSGYHTFTYTPNFLSSLLKQDDYIIATHIKKYNELGLIFGMVITEKNNKIEMNIPKDWIGSRGINYLRFEGKTVQATDKVAGNVNFTVEEIRQKIAECPGQGRSCPDFWEWKLRQVQKAIPGRTVKSFNDACFYVSYIEKLHLWGVKPDKHYIGGANVILEALTWLKNDDPILLAPQHYKITIKKWNRPGYDYSYPRLFFTAPDKNKIYINVVYSFEPSNNTTLFWLPQQAKYKISLGEGDFMELKSADTLDSAQSQYLAYMRDNKNTFNQNYENQKALLKLNRDLSALGVAGTVLTGLAGVTRGGGLTSGLSTVQGGALAFGSYLNVNMRLKQLELSRQATIDDLRNKPATITTGESTNLVSQIELATATANDLYVFEYGATPVGRKVILDYVMRYGYEVGTNNNIRDFVQTRTRFNYVEAEDVFNDIKMPLSARTKQIISDAFTNGLFIWHYRTAAAWKGLKNFTDANDEFVKGQGVGGNPGGSGDSGTTGPTGQPGGSNPTRRSAGKQGK